MNVTSNLLCVPTEKHRRQNVLVQNNFCKTNFMLFFLDVEVWAAIVPSSNKVYSSRLTKNADAYFWKLQSLDFSAFRWFRFVNYNHINFTVAATTGSTSKGFYLLLLYTFFFVNSFLILLNFPFTHCFFSVTREAL